MKKIAILFLIVLTACENKDINEGEEFRPRAVRDTFNDTHFTKVVVDGVEYLMTERDNNNPHEGFGFMAFRANKLMEKQDSVLSYLRAIQVVQNKIYARMYNMSQAEAQAEFDELFLQFLDLENTELETLQKEDLINTENVIVEEEDQ